ncbi:MAG: 3-dehydroquinate synthase [Planctomycetota bacterium]|nr:3-dehydroquinate synthase [Planctomycetota bacterium]
MPTIEVALPRQRYRILIEPGLLECLGALVADAAPADRALLAVDHNVIDPHGGVARRSLRAGGCDLLVHELRAEERAKTLETVRSMYAAMLDYRLERSSPVIAVGGGIVGDVAGFAAATYLRGVPLIHVPTTLLAMVDASIGGKTGVNFPLPADSEGRRTMGKNLIGAFWQPNAVLVDPLVLRTLEARDFRCGLAECIKHGMLADAGLFSFIDSNLNRITALDAEVVTELIARSAQVKSGIVEEDEREAGRRALLNLGHTFAHVIEPIEALDLRHGEAVAIGLRAAARCACETGRLEAGDEKVIVALLEKAGLPTRLTQPVDANRLIDAMGYDKKVAGGRLRLVLPTAPGRAEIADDVPRETILSAWSAVGATGHASRPDGPG